MPALRVIHVDTGRTWRGGQQQVLYLHRGLRDAAVTSLLLCSQGGEVERRAASEGLDVKGLPMRGEWDLASALGIAAEIRRFGATHLHLHSSHAHTLGLLAARLAGLRRVVVTRRVDFVPKRHVFNRWKYGPHVSIFVAISRAIADILVRCGVPAGKIRLVPSGVALASAEPGSGRRVRAELGVGDGQPLIGNIGHLADHKGQRYLIEAAPGVLAKRPDARFVIVGQGELETDLRARAAALGLGQRLTFTGFRNDIPAVLDALDVFVMSSHLEGLGTIVLDALAAGKPVVAARAGGIPDIIEDGVHGLLVPVKDPAALARAVLRLIEEPGFGEALAAAGRRRVEQEFSDRAMVAGNLAVYAELLP